MTLIVDWIYRIKKLNYRRMFLTDNSHKNVPKTGCFIRMTQNDRFLISSNFIFEKCYAHGSKDNSIRLRLICILPYKNLKLNKIYLFEVEFWKVRKNTWHTDLTFYVSVNLVHSFFCVHMTKYRLSVEAIILYYLVNLDFKNIFMNRKNESDSYFYTNIVRRTFILSTITKVIYYSTYHIHHWHHIVY